jgi:hypothetical protein
VRGSLRASMRLAATLVNQTAALAAKLSAREGCGRGRCFKADEALVAA